MIKHMTLALLLAAPAAAGDFPAIIGSDIEILTIRTQPREFRIFPSLPDAYRSGTVELHLHLVSNRADDGGGYGGSYGSGYGGGGTDGFSRGTTAVSKMASDRRNDGTTGTSAGWGGYSFGDGGWGWD